MLVNDYLKAYEDSWQLEYDCRSLDGVFHSLELSEIWEKHIINLNLSNLSLIFSQKTYFDCND